jgi:antitoxin VapB
MYIRKDLPMPTAKIFRSGNSQAVRLPKEFRFKSKEVEIFRRGEDVVLREKTGNLARAYELILGLPDDLSLPDRDKDLPQEREGL